MNKSIDRVVDLEKYKEINKNYKKIKRNAKGITLIALVISITIILVISGISINMLIGENGFLRRTREAKQITEKASAKEQIQFEISGSFNEEAKPNLDNLKDRLENTGAEVKNSDFPLYVIFKGNEYIISENGEISDLGNGGSTNLAKIKAQVSEMNDSEKLNFYQNFYGKTVNYQPKTNIQTSTLNVANTPKTAKWKIFYADEDHIYLIADSYVTYDSLPSNETVSFNRISANNLYKANLLISGLLNYYSGGVIKINSFSKASVLKELNHDFFHYKNPSTGVEEPLTATNYRSMKAIAAMLDTDFWETKYKDNTGYAEYTIGGPSVEMLFASYNQTHETNYGAKAYKAREKNVLDEMIAYYDGYKISLNADAERTSSDWQYSLSMLSNDITKSENSLYVSENNQTNADGYWLASPSSIRGNGDQSLMGARYYGGVHNVHEYDSFLAFRPIICLKSNVLLKALPEGSDYNFELSF